MSSEPSPASRGSADSPRPWWLRLLLRSALWTGGLVLAVAVAGATIAGVALALVIGKPLGVVAASALLVKLGWGRLPPGVSWGGIGLVGLLAGIGFTMAIFIALLAFKDEQLLSAAKLGVLVGSLTAAVVGLVWGWVYASKLRNKT